MRRRFAEPIVLQAGCLCGTTPWVFPHSPHSPDDAVLHRVPADQI